ncbi:glycosyl hydrolase [Flavobacterium sp. W22_SRS_FK3]|uniref:glycosyl hydrolase n=1 Tax=Flavobacterium sp. W22_SRS_FK3 TaxID=3240275 RepID=UPI003F930D8F
MKKLYTFLFFGLSVFLFRIQAQAPNLPVKVNLTTSLSGSNTFSNSTTSDVITFPLSNQTEFTLELKAKINAVQGRGLDVEVKNTAGLGFRASLDKTTFNYTTVLSSIDNLSSSADNAQEQTYRYAVKNGLVNIYQDGHFLSSKALAFIFDNLAAPIVYGSDNLLGRWAGVTGNNSGKPNDYGWANTSASLPWNTANSTSGVRYLDVTSGHTFESNNTSYNGRIMYIRWDNSAYSTSTYSYPVKLEKDLKYEFSWIYEYVSNSAPGTPMNVAISAAPNGNGAIASKTFITGNATKLRKGDFSFIATADGTFYITITAGSGLMAMGDLTLKSSNLINAWDGFTNDNTGNPTAYGWSNSVSSTIFNTANAASGVRYMDVAAGHALESDGTNYAGRLMYIRWDGTQENSVYSFPVQLEASKDYQFSWLYEYISNLVPGCQMNVSVSTEANEAGTIITTKNFVTGAVNKLRKGDVSFQSQAAGTYYINITGDKALFGIGDLKVQTQQMANIVIGKNYDAGAVDMVVSSVTFEDTAYAPEKIISPSAITSEITSSVNGGAYAKSSVVLNGSASLYLKNAYNPLINTTVNLNSANSRLYFENKKPSEVISSYLQYISINGVLAGNGVNAQVTNYGGGAVVAPYSVNEMPLEVFTAENFGGTSQQYAAVTPHDNLAAFDNTIRSFKLKKGYMATFATNADGSGYSRVYIAENQDLEIAVLPVNLNGTISFIRTMKWHEVNKKGLAGGSTEAMDATNITWYYNWNTGMDTTPNVEYVPIRQTNFWPSFTPAYTKEGYTHLLGFNEPDRPDQANMTVEAAIASWPALMKSGLRLGSPATSDPFNPWMGSFMTQAEANNYRIDYVAIHCYWYKTAAQWKSDLQNIYDRYKRPLWITEWNVGANWTGNNFPDGPTLLTDANAVKHKNDLAAILTLLETTDYVERYSIYNWVQDARAMYVTIDDAFKTRNPNWQNYVWLQTAPVISSTATSYVVLTPAGEYYANNASAKAFSSNREYIPTWKTKVETLSYELSSDYPNITINWTGNNHDLVNKYIIERKLDGENDFSVFYETTDYKVIKQVDVVHSKAAYRIKVVGKDNVESAYSGILIFEQAPIAGTPTDIVGKALSKSIINLKWPAVAGAESYTIKRSETVNGTYEDVTVYLKETTFDDINLKENKDYFYKLAAVNTGGESPYSSPLQVKTMAFAIPLEVENATLTYGDARVNLKWDFMYDAGFYVKRATSALGPFTVIATVTANEYQDVSVVNGNSYFYKISAFNALGEGPDSGILSATPAPGQKITGTIIGHQGSYNNSGFTIEKAFDEDITTFVDGPTAIGYLGYDFGTDKKASLTDIRYVPRNGFGNRMPGSEIRGSNSEDYLNVYDVLHVITNTPPNDLFATDSGLATPKYRYIYWYTPTGYGNIAELEFYGSVDTTLSTNKPQSGWAENSTAFPNPTSGPLDINVPNGDSTQKITVYTVDGKVISESDYAVENGKIHLNLEHNSAGLYFVKFQSYPDKTIRIIKK